MKKTKAEMAGRELTAYRGCSTGFADIAMAI